MTSAFEVYRKVLVNTESQWNQRQKIPDTPACSTCETPKKRFYISRPPLEGTVLLTSIRGFPHLVCPLPMGPALLSLFAEALEFIARTCQVYT